MFSRVAAKKIVNFSQKRFASSNLRSGVYKQKTTSEVWLGDVGAYPIMGVIVGAAAFGIVASFYLGSGPDTRLNKNDRKNPFRGAMKDEFAKDQKH